jgi:hypothetical protein
MCEEEDLVSPFFEPGAEKAAVQRARQLERRRQVGRKLRELRKRIVEGFLGKKEGGSESKGSESIKKPDKVKKEKVLLDLKRKICVERSVLVSSPKGENHVLSGWCRRVLAGENPQATPAENASDSKSDLAKIMSSAGLGANTDSRILREQLTDSTILREQLHSAMFGDSTESGSNTAAPPNSNTATAPGIPGIPGKGDNTTMTMVTGQPRPIDMSMSVHGVGRSVCRDSAGKGAKVPNSNPNIIIGDKSRN